MKSGIILLDKPPGITSFDCIRALKRSLKRTDLGHAGTLDLFASGLLPVLAGEGLKLVRFFLESYPSLPTYWKSYEGEIQLGVATETGDPEGDITEKKPVGDLTRNLIQEQMNSFVGVPYMQLPPKYSAKKIAGKRASDLARAGQEPVLAPSEVVIRSFQCEGFESGGVLRFAVECSKGTYVRRLAEELALKLGTVAHVKSLRRTAVGTFNVALAGSLENIAIQGMDVATAFLSPFPLIAGELEQLRVGKIDGLVTRLSNSGFQPGVYCATQESSGESRPIALLELATNRRASFLRAFTQA